MGQGVVYLAADSRRDHDVIARNASVKAALGGVGDDVPKPWLDEAGRRAFLLPLCAGGAIRRFRRLNSSAESALQLVCSRLKAVLLAVLLVQDLEKPLARRIKVAEPERADPAVVQVDATEGLGFCVLRLIQRPTSSTTSIVVRERVWASPEVRSCFSQFVMKSPSF
jgi:hypothetical protein